MGSFSGRISTKGKGIGGNTSRHVDWRLCILILGPLFKAKTDQDADSTFNGPLVNVAGAEIPFTLEPMGDLSYHTEISAEETGNISNCIKSRQKTT